MTWKFISTLLGSFLAASLQESFNRHIVSMNCRQMRLMLKNYDPSQLDPSICHGRALLYAVQDGDRWLVQLLLADKRIDPSNGNYCSLEIAVKNRQTEIVMAFLEDGRIPVDVIYEIAETLQIKWITESVPKQLLQSIKCGRLDELRGTDLNHLQIRHLQFMLRLCAESPIAKCFLAHDIIKKLKPPNDCLERDEMCKYIARLPISSSEEMKTALCRASMVLRCLSNLPEEIAWRVLEFDSENWEKPVDFQTVSLAERMFDCRFDIVTPASVLMFSFYAICADLDIGSRLLLLFMAIIHLIYKTRPGNQRIDGTIHWALLGVMSATVCALFAV